MNLLFHRLSGKAVQTAPQPGPHEAAPDRGVIVARFAVYNVVCGLSGAAFVRFSDYGGVLKWPIGHSQPLMAEVTNL